MQYHYCGTVDRSKQCMISSFIRLYSSRKKPTKKNFLSLYCQNTKIYWILECETNFIRFADRTTLTNSNEIGNIVCVEKNWNRAKKISTQPFWRKIDATQTSNEMKIESFEHVFKNIHDVQNYTIYCSFPGQWKKMNAQILNSVCVKKLKHFWNISKFQFWTQKTIIQQYSL